MRATPPLLILTIAVVLAALLHDAVMIVIPALRPGFAWMFP